MNEININNLQLKILTEQDIKDYCSLNNIDYLNITELNLNNNKLTDISGIRLFKNLKVLSLNNNKIKDISALKYIKNLEYLSLVDNRLKDISILKYLKKLKMPDIHNTEIKDISAVKDLLNIVYLNIIDLKLESEQIQYIDFCVNLEYLWCDNAFKDMSVINQLNNNINIIM